MATIHNTTMTPSKLELLSSWLPTQDWYAGPAAPELRRVGGFRLDDPAGEVGIEFMFVAALGPDVAVTHHVPMTYRAEPLAGAETALIGTSEHGVLGRRWLYDGPADPVLRTQLAELLLGRVRPQHQSRSDEVDERVIVRTTADSSLARDARIRRLLEPAEEPSPGVTAPWEGPDGRRVAGPVVDTVT